MKLMQFLMGLDDTYMQLRINILSRDPLPDAKGAYVLISSEESHTAIVIGLAKQTREPFPLSEHKSTILGELVHLDLSGPYRVVSKEGHRHPQGSKGSASENEMAATSEPDTALSKGDYPDTSTTEHGVN
ncbi:hypothetical protein Tco_1250454 [Tanacetum coccineum]